MIDSVPLTGTKGCIKSMSISAASRLEDESKECRGEEKREVRRDDEHAEVMIMVTGRERQR